MHVVIAPDKFRGSLTAFEAAQAIAVGVRRADPGADTHLAPMADGGEGFVEALVEATGGVYREAEVSGPLGDPAVARFGLLGGGNTAVLAMAAASGHALVPPGRRDILRASTRGTGDLMLAAAGYGGDRLIVGIGGSATNDGGAGMAQALGYRLLDRDGRDLPPGGGALGELDRIDASGVRPELRDFRIEVACDVASPLCGPLGASRVFGPQKGASPEQVDRLDANLAHLAAIIRRDLGVDVLDLPGGGAAGGLGAGLVAFAGATLRPGVDLLIEALGLRSRLMAADLCITGEGCLDASSAAGKTVCGVVGLARDLGVPSLVLAGTVGPGAASILERGATAYFPICPGPITLERAMLDASPLLEVAAEQAARAFLAGKGPRAGLG